MQQKPLIITMGDPTGIGPEIIIQAARQGAFARLAHPVVVAGDLAILQRAADVLGASFAAHALADDPLATHLLVCAEAGFHLQALSRLAIADQVYGSPNVASGQALIAYIDWACRACLQGQAAGMVTAPINKQALQLAGVDFPGHTELLAERCGADEVVMMLAGEKLKVCLVTTHCAYQDVPRQLSVERILRTLRTTNDSLRQQFALAAPKLAVLALNPHAGENGLFGNEEQEVIAPAVKLAQAEKIDALGPFSADSLFHFAVQGQYDAVVCMYHDQGLIPLKLLHFNDAVNVTLGLPIVRTSVDHGTAYDLAGTGKASPDSLVAALVMADQMAGKSNF